MKYLILISLLLSIGCGSTSVGGKPKTLNTSNLVKGEDGVYRLKTEVGKISNGLIIKEPERVISVNKQANYSKNEDLLLSPKQKAERAQHPIVSKTLVEKSENPSAGIIEIKKEEEKDKPLMKINWANLLAFYGLMVWVIFIIYYIWKPFREYKKSQSNPFKKNDPDIDSGSHI